MGGSYKITILIDVNLADFIAVCIFQNNSLTVFDTTHQYLG